jgi:hypothetical protein
MAASGARSSAQTDVETVNPSVDEPTEGLGTLDGMFGKPTVVDEVVEVPMRGQATAISWVIRPNTDIEDMTVGEPSIHYSFKAGTRYKVNQSVAEILYARDYLMEVPYPMKG